MAVATITSGRPGTGLTALVQRHPIAVFLVLALGSVYVLSVIPIPIISRLPSSIISRRPYQANGRSIDGLCCVKNFGPFSVIYRQSSSRIPNSP